MTQTYRPTIKIYQPDGVSLDTSFFPLGVIPQWDKPPEFGWSVYGGCVSGRLSLCLPQAARHAFVVERGQVVKVWQFAEDEAPIWMGVVDEVSRAIGDDYHEVTLRGLWDLVDVEISDETTVGSQAAGTITVGGTGYSASSFDTTGKIVKLLLDKWIVPAGAGITYDAGDITGTTPRALMRLTQGTNFKQALAELALACESVNIGEDGAIVAAPTRWSYGIDGAGKFFFRPVPATLAATVTVGASIIEGGSERPTETGTVAQVVVVGPARRTRGVRAKRTYRYEHGPAKPRPPKIIRLTGTPYERDLATAAAGWLSRYGAPVMKIEGVRVVEAPAAAVPLPWAGLIRWSDPARALSVDSHAASVRAVLGPVYRWEAELGLGGLSASRAGAESGSGGGSDAGGGGGDIDGGDDPYAPSLLDEVLDGTEAQAAADEALDWPECSEGIEGDTDYLGVDPPADELHLAGPDVPYDGLAGSLPPEATDPDLDYGQDAAIKESLAGVAEDVGTLQQQVALLEAATIISLNMGGVVA